MPIRLDKAEIKAKHRSMWPEGQTAENEPPKASTLIRHLDELVAARRPLSVIVYMRESSHDQRKKGNLRNRQQLLERRLKERGIHVVASFDEVTSGKFLTNRPGLIRAIEAARKHRIENQNVVVAVVTDYRNRFIRGLNYNKDAATDTVTFAQLEELKNLANGEILATLHLPDATFREARSYETNVPTVLGEKSGRKVGRPRKRPAVELDPDYDERSAKIECAAGFHREGMPKRKIAKCLGTTEGTIRNWLKATKTNSDRAIIRPRRVRKIPAL